MRMEQSQEVSDWIVKYLRQELSIEERRQLEEWLKESADHRKEFERVCSREFVEELRGSELAYSVPNAFRRFQDGVQRKKRRFLWKRCGQIAAVAVMAIGCGWFVLHSMGQKEYAEQDGGKIVCGTSMARLTLEDGRQIDLRQQTDEVIESRKASVHITGAEIYYTGRAEHADGGIHILEVPRRGEYRLTLADGTKVWLNSETVLRYPAVFTGEKRRVSLEGEAYFEVAKDAEHPFVVELNADSRIEVLGTSFNVQNYQDDPLGRTTLVQGKVKVLMGKQETELQPGEQAVLDHTARELSKSEVNVLAFTSWKDGRFVFRRQRLENIMKTVGRWYDVTVSYASEDLKEITFSGNIERYENFDRIIHLLEITKMVEFQVTGNQITISRK